MVVKRKLWAVFLLRVHLEKSKHGEAGLRLDNSWQGKMVNGCKSERYQELLGTFSIRFFVGNGKPQTTKCHVTTALRSRLQFAVHVWTAGRASSGKWFTARFFATKNCTASRLKVWTSFLYPFAMCLLDFWSRINELLLSFGRLKWCTSTWWKQHGGPKQWMRSSKHAILYSFLPY